MDWAWLGLAGLNMVGCAVCGCAGMGCVVDLDVMLLMRVSQSDVGVAYNPQKCACVSVVCVLTSTQCIH